MPQLAVYVAALRKIQNVLNAKLDTIFSITFATSTSVQSLLTKHLILIITALTSVSLAIILVLLVTDLARTNVSHAVQGVPVDQPMIEFQTLDTAHAQLIMLRLMVSAAKDAL